MPSYEYKVVPAPTKGLKAKGVKTPEGRFANSIESVLNQQAGDGWEYLRAELLPSDERSGLTGSTTHWRNVLVFRRALDEEPKVAQVVQVTEKPDVLRPASGAERMLKDDGVEEISPVSGMTTALLSRVKQQASAKQDADTDTAAEDGDDTPGTDKTNA